MTLLARVSAAVFALSVVLFPAVVSAAFAIQYSSGGSGGLGCTAGGLCGVASNVLYLINSVLVPLLFAIAFIVFLYGIAKTYIFSHGESEAVSDGHRLLLWGLIGFVVMISLWGLVNVVANTFGLGGYSAPPLPTSSSYY